MRNVFLVCYDVADDKRLRKTYKKMCGFGDPMQYSVFRCELSPTEKQLMKESLWAILNWDQDRVMLLNLGPVGTGATSAWSSGASLASSRPVGKRSSFRYCLWISSGPVTRKTPGSLETATTWLA